MLPLFRSFPFSKRRVSFFCLSVLTCFFLGSGGCTHLFQPHGDGTLPETEVLESGLKKHVFHLAGTIGERNVYLPGTMEKSCEYMEKEWKGMGYEVNYQPVLIGQNSPK